MMSKRICCAFTKSVILLAGFILSVGFIWGCLVTFVRNLPFFTLPAEVLPFLEGVVFALVCVCFFRFADVSKKKKADWLDCVLVVGGFLISAALILYLFFPSLRPKVAENLKFEVDVAGVIAAVGALITARFIYRQFQDSKRQFSLTSVQNAFFELYGQCYWYVNIDKLEYPKTKEGEGLQQFVKYKKDKQKFKKEPLTLKELECRCLINKNYGGGIPDIVGVMDLIRLNVQDGTMTPLNARYYLKLVKNRIANKDPHDLCKIILEYCASSLVAVSYEYNELIYCYDKYKQYKNYKQFLKKLKTIGDNLWEEDDEWKDFFHSFGL